MMQIADYLRLYCEFQLHHLTWHRCDHIGDSETSILHCLFALSGPSIRPTIRSTIEFIFFCLQQRMATVLFHKLGSEQLNHSIWNHEINCIQPITVNHIHSLGVISLPEQKSNHLNDGVNLTLELSFVCLQANLIYDNTMQKAIIFLFCENKSMYVQCVHGIITDQVPLKCDLCRISKAIKIEKEI